MPDDLARVTALELSFGYRYAAAGREATAWLEESGHELDPVLLRRVQLVKANADSRYGAVEQGAISMRSIRDWAIEQRQPYLQARAEHWLANLLRRAGEGSSSLEAAVASVRLLPDDAPTEIRADHLNVLADALAMAGSVDESIERYREALAAAETTSNFELRVLVLNNLAYTFYEAERIDEAMEICERIFALTNAEQRPLTLHAQDTIANIYLAAGREREALELLAVDEIPDDVLGEDVGELCLTLARVYRAQGDLDGSEAQLDRALELAGTHALGRVEVLSLQERAELLAARGDFAGAYECHKVFHARHLELQAEQREASARMMHALFETDQARRESAHFRELSYRDSLTRLYNRRYVDEHLSLLLDRSNDDSEPVSVAFIDLDHFKQVNDTFTHEVGDDVLRRLAAVLEQSAATSEGGFAARMGGEEFLVVMPATSLDVAAGLLEDIRRTVESHDWAVLDPDLHVTVSAGVAASGRDGLDRVTLLARADRRLYAAKRLGRNRVVAS